METTSPASAERPGPPPPGPPASSRSEAWDEAFVRIESYLHAHRLPSRVAINRITNAVIEEARRLAAGRPDLPPVAAAMGLLRAEMARWYQGVFPEAAGDEALRARGRLALIASGSPARFLAEAEPDAGLAAALRAARLESGPELRLSSMPPAPLEFAIAPAEPVTFRVLRQHGLVQAAGLWMLIIGAMGAAWAASH